MLHVCTPATHLIPFLAPLQKKRVAEVNPTAELWWVSFSFRWNSISGPRHRTVPSSRPSSGLVCPPDHYQWVSHSRNCSLVTWWFSESAIEIRNGTIWWFWTIKSWSWFKWIKVSGEKMRLFRGTYFPWWYDIHPASSITHCGAAGSHAHWINHNQYPWGPPYSSSPVTTPHKKQSINWIGIWFIAIKVIYTVGQQLT